MVLEELMSALGHKRTCALQNDMSAIPPTATAKADIPDACLCSIWNTSGLSENLRDSRSPTECGRRKRRTG